MITIVFFVTERAHDSPVWKYRNIFTTLSRCFPKPGEKIETLNIPGTGSKDIERRMFNSNFHSMNGTSPAGRNAPFDPQRAQWQLLGIDQLERCQRLLGLCVQLYRQNSGRNIITYDICPRCLSHLSSEKPCDIVIHARYHNTKMLALHQAA